MTTDSSTLMEHLLLERDTEVPTVEVDALGVTVVEDGDQLDGQHLSSVPHACWCEDKRCRDDRDRLALSNYHGFMPVGAHPITVHTYIVISEGHS
jgi:hypothetical protein